MSRRSYTMPREKKTRKATKAHNGAGSMYYLKSRRKWVVAVTIDGKQHYSYFDTDDEAKEHRAKEAYDTKYAGVKPADRRMTVHSYCVQWLELKNNITPNVRATYAGHLERHLKKSRLGKMKLADVE